VDPVFSAKSYGTHRVLRQVSAELEFGIFQESRELVPQAMEVQMHDGRGKNHQGWLFACLGYLWQYRLLPILTSLGKDLARVLFITWIRVFPV
jgi:hypothetical protein